jgi:hypothetical protein
MSRRRRMGRALVFAAVVVYFSTGVAAGVSLRALARAPSEGTSRLIHDAVLGTKDVLLRTIHVGNRILVGATKRYAELTGSGTEKDCASGSGKTA